MFNWQRHGAILGTILVCAAVFLAQQSAEPRMSEKWGMVPSRVLAAWETLPAHPIDTRVLQPLSTLVTHTFLHGGIEHILYNMVFLWTFGSLTSQLLGPWRTLAAYFVCGIIGAIGHIWLNMDSNVPTIGASGAINGLEGLYVGLALRWQLPNAEVWPLAYPVSPMQLVAFAAVGFVGDILLLARHDQHIAYGAHLGGLLAGIIIAALITTIYPTLRSYEGSTSSRGWRGFR